MSRINLRNVSTLIAGLISQPLDLLRKQDDNVKDVAAAKRVVRSSYQLRFHCLHLEIFRDV